MTMGIWLKCAMGRHFERKIPLDDPLVLSMRTISDHHFFCAPFEHAVREITTNSMVTYYHEFTCKSSVDGMHPSSRTEHGTPWRVPPTIAARGSVTSSYIVKLAARSCNYGCLLTRVSSRARILDSSEYNRARTSSNNNSTSTTPTRVDKASIVVRKVFAICY